MAKQRYEELKKNPGKKRQPRPEWTHHEFIITNHRGGKNLYLDKKDRDDLIANTLATHDFTRGKADLHEVVCEILHPPGAFNRPKDLPRYQRAALAEFTGVKAFDSEYSLEHRPPNKFDSRHPKLKSLVDTDLAVRDHAWQELTELLDKWEHKLHPQHFSGNTEKPGASR